MRDTEPVATPSEEQLREQVRDALRHLYDGAFLAAAPLGASLFPDLPPRGSVRSKALRLKLLDAIEALRPEGNTPTNSGDWRTYNILMLRYVEARSTDEVMQRVGLAHSQYHEEHRSALETLVTSLQELQPGGLGWGVDAQPGRRMLLQREIGRMRSKRESSEVSLSEVLDGVIRMFRPMIAQKGLALTCDLKALASLPRMRADGRILRQLFVQILGNVLRLVHQGQIALSFRSYDGGTEIEISSDGETEERAQVADWAIRDLARALGGSLRECQQDAGMQLIVRLPKRRKKLAVLIDNDPDLGTLFARYLHDSGWNLVSTPSAHEGLSLVKRVQPDAVILDVIMPDHDGWQVLSSLRADEAMDDVVVVVCSVLEQPELALALGADMFLPKPVSQTSLLRAIDRLEDMETDD